MIKLRNVINKSLQKNEAIVDINEDIESIKEEIENKKFEIELLKAMQELGFTRFVYGQPLDWYYQVEYVNRIYFENNVSLSLEYKGTHITALTIEGLNMNVIRSYYDNFKKIFERLSLVDKNIDFAKLLMVYNSKTFKYEHFTEMVDKFNADRTE